MKDFDLFLEAADSDTVFVNNSDLPWFFKDLVAPIHVNDPSKLRDCHYISDYSDKMNRNVRITKRTKETLDAISKWKVLKIASRDLRYAAEDYAEGLGYSIGNNGNFSVANDLIVGRSYGKAGNFILSKSSEILDDIKDYITNLRRMKAAGKKSTKEYLIDLFGDVEVKALRENGRFSVVPKGNNKTKLVVYVNADDSLIFDSLIVLGKLSVPMIDGLKRVLGS